MIRLQRKRINLAWALALCMACAPNRSQWMQQAATQQAANATGSIGDVAEVKREAGQASAVLDKLSSMMTANPAKGHEAAAAAFAADAYEVSSGLSEIADSKTDSQFTNAVWGMCVANRKEAEPRVGRAMLIFSGVLDSKAPANAQNREQTIAYFRTFGHRLINMPVKCDQAGNAMAEASAQEQQAEITHTQNVNNAMTAAAVVFAGTVLFASAVGSAAATRPPVTQEYNTNYNY
jgi:hypothetical protein